MGVKLLTTPEHIEAMEYNAAYAMLTCHANTERLKHEPARNFIERAIKAGHGTILEHITLTYEVNNLSRACLQELARHRHISLSVESTRHTLRKKFSDTSYDDIDLPEYTPTFAIHFSNKEKFLYQISMRNLELLATTPEELFPNDEIKYFIPEFWPTNLVLTANVHELRHIVKLRTAPAALKEFQNLARKFVNVLPSRFKYLLEDCVYVDKK